MCDQTKELIRVYYFTCLRKKKSKIIHCHQLLSTYSNRKECRNSIVILYAMREISDDK